MINFETINTFEGGNSKDINDNLERKNTFTKGLNGRIYSKNGVFSFSSIEGSTLAYENSEIIKYLGVHSFRDEAIVFAKCTKKISTGTTTCTKHIDARNFGFKAAVTAGVVISVLDEVSTNSYEYDVCTTEWTAGERDVTETILTAQDIKKKVSNSIVDITYTTEISDNTTFKTDTYKVVVPEKDIAEFGSTPYSSIEDANNEIDFREYYKENVSVADYSVCPLNINNIPINNKDYYDTIISFTLDKNGNLVGERLWTGAQNWPTNGKITCEGVEENEFYKRVYYSDAVNPRRVMNRKDSSLSRRRSKDFSQIIDNVLLQPEIKEVREGGQLKSMRAMYLYRKISENGQVSEFSPFSKFVSILPEDDPIKFRGGQPSEPTGKMVTVKCNIINANDSSQVECIALEFEALGVPTAIKNLGIKPANAVVEFSHFGNEPEMTDNITIHDITELKNTWKYCNDFSFKKNKLIAGGLRNSPIPTQIANMEYLFPLHAWDSAGGSYKSLMNPKPWTYRYIDPTSTAKLVYVKQKNYENISSFGPLTLKLVNKETLSEISLTISDLNLEKYTEISSRVLTWLLDQQANNLDFNTYFPNLKIVDNYGKVLMTYIDETKKTDFESYVFESNNDQFIENFENDIVFLDPAVDTTKFVHGAQSIGFSQGNGVRISYRAFKEPLLKQATGTYTGAGKILDFVKPSMENYCMKGEIYRLAFQGYDASSSRYFAIPLGDVMIPEIDDTITSIDDNGNPVITAYKYVNQSVENGILYGHGIKMHIEVRLDCELQKMISMYQLLYVERTEDNRTILCQGIAAPLQRVQTDNNDHNKMPTPIQNKWTLPYYGGPVYERLGLTQYDYNGENYIYTGEDASKRVITNRRLMYFDSPDLYFGKISDQHLRNANLQVLAKVNTDHTPGLIMNYGKTWSVGGYSGTATETYPKFSRKIYHENLDGNINAENLPRDANEDPENDISLETYFINVSVFSKYTPVTKRTLNVQKSETLNRGEVISGSAFNLSHDVSNNAIAMASMPWFFGSYQRKWGYHEGRPKVQLFNSAVTSKGYPTSILKTDYDLFTDSFIGADVHTVEPDIRLGGSKKQVYDTYPIINIFRNNRESVYGGRSEQAYSRNTYIPLSRTIPVSGNTGIQSFDVGADTYITLNVRTKVDAGDDEIQRKINLNNGGTGRDAGDLAFWQRNGAWNYVVVLESQVEPKLSQGEEFYRETGPHNFEVSKIESINEAYFNVPNLKQFIPKPFQYKDDPDLGNLVAVSNVKMAGEPYDSWTIFKPNNFYAELEKNKGDVSNLVRWKDQLFAVQDDQTSMLYIGTDRVISDSNGNPINIKQGSGQVVEGHKVLSSYGTAIRRAVASSDYGFVFFDEKHIEFVKVDKPLLSQNLLHIDYWNQLRNNPIVDCEAYFDHEHKESNIRIRTEDSQSILISYNEMFNVFNGEYEYNNDLYIPFDKKVYASVQGVSSQQLHQLNVGNPLNLFGVQKHMKVGIMVNTQPGKVLQYKTLGAVTNLPYPIKQVLYKSSTNQERVVLGTHSWYKIREGVHTLPALNDTTDPLSTELSDIRGNWIYVEVTAESLQQNKIDILAIINSLRFSHQ